jgi:hypothetical protein
MQNLLDKVTSWYLSDQIDNIAKTDKIANKMQLMTSYLALFVYLYLATWLELAQLR